MNKEKINIELLKNHTNYIEFIDNLSEVEYNFTIPNKWNAGQHTEHILKSLRMLNKALLIPKWVLKLKFGIANRPSKNYDDFVVKYLDRLKSATPTLKSFQPQITTFSNRKKLLQQIENANLKLLKKITKISERNLDTYILPHPLMGKQTLREFFLFTIYHIEQHQNFIRRDLKLQNNL